MYWEILVRKHGWGYYNHIAKFACRPRLSDIKEDIIDQNKADKESLEVLLEFYEEHKNKKDDFFGQDRSRWSAASYYTKTGKFKIVRNYDELSPYCEFEPNAIQNLWSDGT